MLSDFAFLALDFTAILRAVTRLAAILDKFGCVIVGPALLDGGP